MRPSARGAQPHLPGFPSSFDIDFYDATGTKQRSH